MDTLVEMGSNRQSGSPQLDRTQMLSYPIGQSALCLPDVKMVASVAADDVDDVRGGTSVITTNSPTALRSLDLSRRRDVSTGLATGPPAR